jgi:hypothetical protein
MERLTNQLKGFGNTQNSTMDAYQPVLGHSAILPIKGDKL